MSEQQLSWRINHQIRAQNLRVIDGDGKQIGILSLSEALGQAQEAGLDLVEIAPKANPPVAKIIDFGKFRYAEEKKQKEQKKKAKPADIKEIRFSPFIGDGDYQTRIARMEEFLEDGHKIRVVVVFKGRQLGSRQFGYDLLRKILSIFNDRVVVDMEPKFLGRHLGMVISPIKQKKKEKIDVESQNTEIADQENSDNQNG